MPYVHHSILETLVNQNSHSISICSCPCVPKLETGIVHLLRLLATSTRSYARKKISRYIPVFQTSYYCLLPRYVRLTLPLLILLLRFMIPLCTSAPGRPQNSSLDVMPNSAGLVALFIIVKSMFDSIISAQFIIELLLYKSLPLKLNIVN